MFDPNATFTRLSFYAHRASFVSLVALTIAAPWCFGSWEMHWFWLSAGILFLAAFFAGAGTLLDACTHATDETQFPFPRFRSEKRLAFLALSAAPFLLYLAWRLGRPVDAAHPVVAMEAQRCALLFLTPCLLVATLFLVLNRRRLRILAGVFYVNCVLLALCAAHSYFTSGGNQILWVASPFAYRRACAPFFCPNSFVDMMNFALFLALSLLVSRGIRLRTKLLVALGLPAILTAWFFTMSRGGILSFAATLPLFIVLGFRGYRPLTRWLVGLVSLALVLGGLWALFNVPNPIKTRFDSHSVTQAVLHYRENGDKAKKTLSDAFHYGFDRGLYIDAALRAWRSSPVLGIGPGQHSPRWPQFAASDDGDATADPVKFPRVTNHYYHSYEVHSDWVQLLEEFGIIGFALFLVAAACWTASLVAARHHGFSHHRPYLQPADRAFPLCALLCTASMAFHSFGDFSLQIPAVTWAFATLLALGCLSTLSERGEESSAE